MEPDIQPDILSGRPLIEYPCRWEYTTIGWDEALVRAAVAEIMAGQEHELNFARRSPAGRYCSLLLALTVESEEQRDAIFTALKGHRDIRMVL